MPPVQRHSVRRMHPTQQGRARTGASQAWLQPHGHRRFAWKPTRSLVEVGSASPSAFDVMIEVDSDGPSFRRESRRPLLIDIAQALTPAGGANLKGVLTHAGSSYDLNTPEALGATGRTRAPRDRCSRRAAASGRFCPARRSALDRHRRRCRQQSLSGVTEVRTGCVCVFRPGHVECRCLLPAVHRPFGADHRHRPSSPRRAGSSSMPDGWP